MAEERIYIGGFKTFAPSAKAPDFVLGSIIVDLDSFGEFVKAQKEHITLYEGKRQLKMQLLKDKSGRPSLTLDTWKPDSSAKSSSAKPASKSKAVEENDDLPF